MAGSTTHLASARRAIMSVTTSGMRCSSRSRRARLTCSASSGRTSGFVPGPSHSSSDLRRSNQR